MCLIAPGPERRVRTLRSPAGAVTKSRLPPVRSQLDSRCDLARFTSGRTPRGLLDVHGSNFRPPVDRYRSPPSWHALRNLDGTLALGLTPSPLQGSSQRLS